MPAPIIGDLISYIATQLEISVWDGEVPRYDNQGQPINPNSGTPNWPVVKLYMQEGGFSRTWTTEDAFDDRGGILIQVWATQRSVSEALMNSIEALLAKSTNWIDASQDLGGDMSNPNYIIQLLLERWYSGQEESARTGDSELLYRGDLHYDCHVHGAVSTA